MKLNLQESNLHFVQEKPVFGQKRNEGFLQDLGFLPYEDAIDAGQIHQGNFLICYEVGNAEGTYQLEHNQLVWREPENQNIHIDVTVQNRGEKFIDYLNIYAVLIGPDEKVISGKPLPYAWHPWKNHYGENFSITTPGIYELQLHFENPEYQNLNLSDPELFPAVLDISYPNLCLFRRDIFGY
jgi:hypothetical protein